MGANWIKQLEKRAAGEIEGFHGDNEPLAEEIVHPAETLAEAELKKQLAELEAKFNAMQPVAQPEGQQVEQTEPQA